MGWDKGRYYTRTRRVDGVRVREYFGCGPEAERAAREDIEARDRRRNQQLEEQIERDTCDALDAPFEEIDHFTAMAVDILFEQAGYHRHDRGPWRKRRTPRPQACPVPLPPPSNATTPSPHKKSEACPPIATASSADSGPQDVAEVGPGVPAPVAQADAIPPASPTLASSQPDQATTGEKHHIVDSQERKCETSLLPDEATVCAPVATVSSVESSPPDANGACPDAPAPVAVADAIPPSNPALPAPAAPIGPGQAAHGEKCHRTDSQERTRINQGRLRGGAPFCPRNQAGGWPALGGPRLGQIGTEPRFPTPMVMHIGSVHNSPPLWAGMQSCPGRYGGLFEPAHIQASATTSPHSFRPGVPLWPE